MKIKPCKICGGVRVGRLGKYAKKGTISPMKGKYHTKESKEKIRKSKLGKKYPKISIALSGRHFSEEHKRKISEANKGKPHYIEWNKKVGKAKMGKKRKPFSKKWKENISKSLKGRKIIWVDKLKGEKCHFWKDGKSHEPYSVDWTETLKRSIRERDKYVCQICGKEPSIYVHHIDYDKKNCNPDNLTTLCHSCHSKTNSNREKWINYFKEKE